MNNHHQFELFLNCINDGVIFISSDEIVEFVNIAFLQHLGIGRQLVVGAHVNDVVLIQRDNYLVSGIDTPFNKVLKGNRLFNSDQDREAHYVIARSDRTVFPAQIIAMPFEFDGVSGVLAIIHDKSNEEKIEQAKSEFVALISHHLRTPVSIISWYVEKLMHQKKGALNNRQMDYLKEVYRSNRRIIELVQAVVNVSRTDLSRLKHKHELVDVKSILERICNDSQTLVDENDLSLVTSLLDVKLEDSDQELVAVACRNVLNNALHYTSDGGHISVNLNPVSKGTTLDPDTGRVAQEDGALITISDDGVGIPDEEKYRIFSKLFRGSNVQTLDVNGIGLGLYVAKSFTDVLGGHIWFESEIRRGSTFYIYFPKR